MSLSDKIKDLNFYEGYDGGQTYDMDDDKEGNWLNVEDVRKAIKKLNQKFCIGVEYLEDDIIKYIEEIFGKELMGEETK